MTYILGYKSPHKFSVYADPVDLPADFYDRIDYLSGSKPDPAAELPGVERTAQGIPVDPDTMPKAMRWGDGRVAPTDVFASASTLVVSERVRDLVERFDPGVHQLLPVALHPKRGGEPLPYHWLIICSLLDSVDAERTTFNWQGDRSRGIGFWNGRGDPSRELVFNRAQIGDRHLWRDRYMIRTHLFVSDAFHDALADAGATGWSARRYPEV